MFRSLLFTKGVVLIMVAY